MSAFRSGLVAFALVAGFAGTSSAQIIAGGSGFSNGFSGAAVGANYYGVASGYGNYGFPGGYSAFNGNQFGGAYYSGQSFPAVVPQTYNNMGGLMNTIRTQTGRSNSYRYGSAYGVRRRGR